MQAVQPVSGAGDVTTNGFRINDPVVYLMTRTTPRSVYVGIKSGTILEFKASQARVGHRKGRSAWVNVRLLRPTSYRALLEQVFTRHME